MATVITTTTHCSFCTKDEADVAQMVAGPGVHICNECVARCGEIFATDTPGGDASTIPYWQAMSDEDMLAHLPRIASVATQVEDNLRVWV